VKSKSKDESLVEVILLLTVRGLNTLIPACQDSFAEKTNVGYL
jgi:hypothetical protein